MIKLLVEVAYARSDRQKIISLRVTPGCDAREAVRLSGIVNYFPEIQIDTAILGVFGKVIQKPESYSVNSGDRIEIYRSLAVDPKEMRRLREKKVKKNT